MVNKKNRKKNEKKVNKKVLKGIIKITAKPIGFVIVNEPASAKGFGEAKEDIIVFEENLDCALDKDEVEVEVIGSERGRKKGRVIKIIKRNKTQFVGTIEKSGLKTLFRPDDFKFYRQVDIYPNRENGRVFDFPKTLESGTKVLAEISWTNPNLNPVGKIISVIGKKGEHETEMQSILLDKGIVYNFPAEVEKEAEEIAKEFRNQTSPPGPLSLPRRGGTASSSVSSALPSPDQGEGARRAGGVFRQDFRKVLTFTIDPADAKDFDDAISYENLGNDKIRVGVHIADVSHFVRPGNALDREARKRSFSTYLVDRTIPMLPEVLSNDLCSLVPNEDRFTFSAVFDIEKETGRISDRWFGRTVINSNKRFNYEEAQKLLELRDTSNELRSGEAEFSRPLQNLDRIAKIYREENKKNGAIEFETDEVRFELDGEGKPLRVYKKSRLDTMKMIEEWMLLANREVAKFISDKLGKRGGASIFRIHDLPKMEKIEELAIFVRALGHDLPITNGEVTAKDINLLLAQVEGKASESLIKTAAIRSMAKAIYSTKNIGHFGLAFEYYTHFTSPIRRYPDLMVHRILEKHLKNEPIPKDEFAKFEKIAQEASEKEVTIAEAERESIKYKQVEFMKDRVGTEFEGVISGVTEWGMYVEDSETKAEGMVRIKDMEGDYYKLDQRNYAIVGERTKKKFSLGDSIRVRLISADLDRKTLDFKLV